MWIISLLRDTLPALADSREVERRMLDVAASNLSADWVSAIAQVFTLGAAIVAGGYAGKAAKESRRQADAAADQLSILKDEAIERTAQARAQAFVSSLHIAQQVPEWERCFDAPGGDAFAAARALLTYLVDTENRQRSGSTLASMAERWVAESVRTNNPKTIAEVKHFFSALVAMKHMVDNRTLSEPVEAGRLLRRTTREEAEAELSTLHMNALSAVQELRIWTAPERAGRWGSGPG